MEKNHNKSITIILSLILAVLVLSNLSALWAPISGINSILTPIYIGFILAFLLNPIVKMFERKVYCKIKKPRLVRALSVLSSYVLVAAILVGFAFIMIPQIVDSVTDLIGNSPRYINILIETINNLISQKSAVFKCVIREHPNGLVFPTQNGCHA